MTGAEGGEVVTRSECSRGLVGYSKNLGSYLEQVGEQCEGSQ